MADLCHSGACELSQLNPESPHGDSLGFTTLDQVSDLSLLDEIRLLAADLSTDRSVGPHRCADWTSGHISTALSQGIGLWLYMELLNYPEVELAPEFHERLSRVYAQSMLQSLSNQACFREVVAALAAQHIHVLALKGVYLGTFVYRNPALRPMCDLDLLVRQEDFDRARKLLDKLAFKISAEPLEGEYRDLQPALAHIRPGTIPCTVDLHRALLSMDYYRFPSELVWQNVVQGELYGQPVFFLSNEFNFIHLGIHTLTHLNLLRDWLDLILFLRRINLDWDKLAALAGSSGVLRPLYWVFHELQKRWGVVAPKRFTSSLACYVPARMEDRIIKHRFRYLWRIVARLHLLPSWALRLRYLRMRTFSPAGQGERALGLRGWLMFVLSKVNLLVTFFRRR